MAPRTLYSAPARETVNGLRRSTSMGTKETKLMKKRQKLSTSGVNLPAISLAETQLPPQTTMEMTMRTVKISREFFFTGACQLSEDI